MPDEKITLAHGSGGREMQELVRDISSLIYRGKGWKNVLNDGASMRLGDRFIVFTTDSFVADPLFFPGGNIGKIAACGTINDLAVMGADPAGISMAAIIEEGMDKGIVMEIVKSANVVFRKEKIPFVTVDTKVMEKWKIDMITLTTSGIGIAGSILEEKISAGDAVIVSGGIGEHATALLSRRFDFETSIKSDSKALTGEMKAIRNDIKQAKDITRGGLAGALNELCEKDRAGMEINEKDIPVKKEVRATAELLGLEVLEFACEGRLVCVCSARNARKVLGELKKFSKDASLIGRVTKGNKVILKTRLGKRVMEAPRGRIIPRIC